MKTRTGNKVKNKKNNIHNEKGWLALNGLANLYFLFLEKVNARVIFSSKSFYGAKIEKKMKTMVSK